MSTKTNHNPKLFVLSLFLTFIFAFEIENNVASSFNFYQRDSFGSPFYNASLSKTEIIRRAIARSINKLNLKMATPNTPTSNVFHHHFEYMMKIRLGTPPVDIIGTVDTGSDLTWTQCKPFTQSVPQHMPLFDIHASSSYAKIPCGPTRNCPHMAHSKCEADGWCHYSIRYFDSTYSKGFLSTEIMSIDSTHGNQMIEIPNFIFGCGIITGGSMAGGESSGVIGLGAGPRSLVSQLGCHSMMRFSYCLIQLGLQGKVGHIRFGQDANVNGLGTVVVPLVTKSPSTHYFTTIKAFTVGGVRIDCVSLSGKVKEGNTFLDSGTTVIELPMHLYARIKHTVIMQTNAPPVPDPRGLLDLCFTMSSSLELPNIVANFRGGDVEFKRYNAFVDFESVSCLAFGAGREEIMVYGNMPQQDFIVGYDRYARTISFKPFDCTEF